MYAFEQDLPWKKLVAPLAQLAEQLTLNSKPHFCLVLTEVDSFGLTSQILFLTQRDWWSDVDRFGLNFF